ncbi:hypothetical protein MKW98_029614, partial [Papaver atlanticum]
EILRRLFSKKINKSYLVEIGYLYGCNCLPSDPVYVAAKKMRDLRVLSVIITTGNKPHGILNSKDVLMQVVAQNLSAELTLVEKLENTLRCKDINQRCNSSSSNTTTTRKFSVCTRPCQSSMRTASCWTAKFNKGSWILNQFVDEQHKMMLVLPGMRSSLLSSRL